MIHRFLLASALALSPCLGGCSGTGDDAFWCAMFFGVGGSDNNGFIAGSGGSAWQTTDGGQTAMSVDLGIAYAVNDIRFTGPAIGFMVGADGSVLRTTDGGGTWTHSMLPGTSASLQQLEWAGPFSSRGWIFGHGGVIARTDDDGLTWTLQQTGTGFDFYGGCFSGADLGWGVGQQGMIMGTTDGGDTWTAWTSGVDVTLRGCFRDLDFGQVVGDDGTILETTDGGNSWNPVAFPFSNNLFSISYKPDMSGWAAIGGTGGVWVTQDFGNTWTPTLTALGTFKRVQFLASGWVYAITNRREAYQSQDDGQTWQRLQFQIQVNL